MGPLSESGDTIPERMEQRAPGADTHWSVALQGTMGREVLP